MTTASEVHFLRNKIEQLEKRCQELNLALMRKSAEASEATEDLKRIKMEWEIAVEQSGHNLCHKAILTAIKFTLGHTGNYPDPDNITGEEFAHGCVDYQSGLFPDCPFRLKVIKTGEVE